MNLKKLMAASSAALLVALCGTTAFAHHGYGHGYGYRASQQATYQNCSYEDCYNSEVHTHDGDNCYYYGHYQGDGHTHCAGTTANTGCRSYCHNHL